MVRRRLVALLIVAWLLPVALAAQSVRGRVLDGFRGVPLAGALVEIQDSSGQPLQRGLASPTGGFRFLLAGPGRYRLRVAAIGYSPLAPRPVEVAAGENSVPDLAMQPAAAILPDVVAAGKRKMCGREILDDPLLGRLLEGARTSLTVMEQSIGLGTRFAVEEVRTRTMRTSRGSRVTVDSVLGEMARWPLESADETMLRAEGFARVLAPEEGQGRVYYGPDLRVLFAEWFLDGHCFAFDIKEKEADPGVLVVRYEPRQKSKLVDIAGELRIDPVTLSLQELTFVHRNLPGHIKEGAAGGSLAFARLDGGAWLPVRWRIFAPVEASLSQVRVTRSVGIGAPRQAVRLPPRASVTGSLEMTGRVVGAAERR